MVWKGCKRLKKVQKGVERSHLAESGLLVARLQRNDRAQVAVTVARLEIGELRGVSPLVRGSNLSRPS